MAPPDVPYLTQQWSGITHYICPKCGYNTFMVEALEGHRCAPREDAEAVIVTADAPPEELPAPVAPDAQEG